MKVQIISTSCNRRDLELEQIRRFLLANGHEVSQEDFNTDKSADCIIISTCGFTQAAEDFGVKTIKRVKREKKAKTRIIVGGCLPKINPEAITGYQMFDPQSYDKLNDFFDATVMFDDIRRPNTVGDARIHAAYREHGLTDSMLSNDEESAQTRKDNIKNVEKITSIMRSNNNESFRVQCLTGCACKCTYCAIKFAIGPVKSVPVDEILKDIDIGIKNGYKNILLEGDSLGGYGIDIGTNLGYLFDKIYDRIKDTDVQISLPDISPLYIEKCISQITKFAEANKLFNLYIPIQSGSQKILNAMKRGYNIKQFIDVIKPLKEMCPNLSIGTSVIVGFPGETEEDFMETIDVCRQIKFDYIHAHSYSDRKGTEASELEDKVPAETILRRSRDLKFILADVTPIITIAEDTKGNRTCQG